MTVRLTTLNNGLRVVTDAMPHLKTATVGVWVDAGARDESAAENGVAHLLEHMAFKGTERRTARAIAEEIEAVGGQIDAYTSREQTAFYARVMSEDVPLAVDILADILQHPVFSDVELERERQVVIQEIGQAEDTPDDIVFDLLQETAFPGQALGRSILGTVAGVGAMTRNQLADYMARHYKAPKMVLAAAGGLDHEQLVALAADAFAGLARGGDATETPAVFQGGDARRQRDLEQVHFTLAVPGVSFADPDFHAVQIYSTILGGGMSSRLFQEVREVRGLAYAVFSFASSFSDGGLFGVYAATGEREAETLVPVLLDEMHKLSERVGEDEVARAKAQLKAGLLMSLESSSARAEQLGRQVLTYGRPLVVEELLAAVAGVDGDAVMRVGRRLLAGTQPAVAAIGRIQHLASYPQIAAQFTGARAQK